MCKFGPDASGGDYVEEIVETGVARLCGAFCECVGLVNSTCYIGPDDTGNFFAEVVSSELADSCDRSFCVCDTHIFAEDEGGVTFETILEERRIEAADKPSFKKGVPLVESE